MGNVRITRFNVFIASPIVRKLLDLWTVELSFVKGSDLTAAGTNISTLLFTAHHHRLSLAVGLLPGASLLPLLAVGL